MKTGTFIISLDFELFWGIFDHAEFLDKQTYFENTLQAIPQILDLFKQYKIRATWATVGFLFYKNYEELINDLPSQLPKYQNPKLSAYHFIKNNRNIIKKYPKYFFAPDIIKLINQTEGQEIGSHTLSHYYCLEPGQNIIEFKFDIQKNIELAKKQNIDIKSLVFPRNQHNMQYEKIVSDVGINYIRSNPAIWFWNMNSKETLLKKIFRTADAYIPLSQPFFNKINNNKLPVKIPASRFFRPPGKNKYLNKLRITRIKNEMTSAAKNNINYHLWWHPHNFGSNPDQSLADLTEILNHYKNLHVNKEFQSQTISDFL